MNIVLKTQQAIYSLLNSGTSLMNKITGVFDYVPEGQDFPYITIGEIKSRRIYAVGVIAEELQLSVKVFSKNSGRKEVLEIIQEIKILLDEAELTISGCKNSNTKFVKQEVLQNKDGNGFAGLIEFRLVVQEL